MLDLRELDTSEYDLQQVNNLKGGKGTCAVYTKKTPTAPNYEEGAIIMMETNGVYPSIGMHTHTDDEETWTFVIGFFDLNGKIYGPGDSVTCKQGESHSAQLISSCGTIQFQKTKPSGAA